jgi:putative ABC transport system permease protein
MRFLRYILRSLLRNRVRTALTVLGTAGAMFLWVFVEVMQRGLDRTARESASETKLVVYYRNRFCPATSLLPERYAATIRKVPGVVSVLPVKVYVNNCRASLDVVTFHGLPPELVGRDRPLRMLSGDLDGFAARRDAALVGQRLAARRGLHPGDKFSVGGMTVTVGGVFASEAPEEESLAYTHLEFLQRQRAHHGLGYVTQFEVKVADPSRLEGVAQAIDEAFRGDEAPTQTRPARAHVAQAAADVLEIIGFTRWLGYVCVAVILVLNANTAVMAVQDRVTEHAVLQTLGFTPGLILRLILAESVLVGLLGGLLGVGAAMLALHRLQLGVSNEGVRIEFLPEPAAALAGLAVSLAVGAAAGLVPAWQAGRAEIVAGLRRV